MDKKIFISKFYQQSGTQGEQGQKRGMAKEGGQRRMGQRGEYGQEGTYWGQRQVQLDTG